ncbi:MAG: class I SAM-dependent methyltransferase [Opitutaceae bacterium]|nr:class I SAM-dependent methyltransferase [Opitutaceae bacterium]
MLNPDPAAWPAPLLYFDSPAFPVASPGPVQVTGWLAGNFAFGDVRLDEKDGRSIPLTIGPRPDVEGAFPGFAHVAGFSVVVDRRDLADDALTFRYSFGGVACCYRRSLAGGIDPAVKQSKLDRIRAILRPGLDWVERPGCLDFLTDELRQTAHLSPTDAVSSNPYDAYALGLFSFLPDGLILDAGAGFNPDYRPNVVNLEVVDYPTCDVLAAGERLPFRDGSFDAVLSLAVLEHVRDPFACAAEIQRVLKPGGLLCAVVPFLQPYHGFPHHYYNMTAQGLRNLFSGLTVIAQQVPLSGLPIWSLGWYIREYSESLPQAERRAFHEMKIGELLRHPTAYLGEGFVRALPESANFTLASTTMLLATK